MSKNSEKTTSTETNSNSKKQTLGFTRRRMMLSGAGFASASALRQCRIGWTRHSSSG